MKIYIHIVINLIWLVLFFLAVILTNKGFFTVSERLDILDAIGIVAVLIFSHFVFILVKVKDKKLLNAVICMITLCTYLFFPGNFNPF